MNFENPEKINRQAHWDKVRDSVDRIVDGLGRGIDDGIKDAVTSFIVHDFPTDASCDALPENHPDGTASTHPWVEVYVPEPEGWKKSAEIKSNWEAKNLKERARMEGLVEEFYKDADSDDEKRLFFSNIGIFGGFRINSQSLEEMNRFAKFLKDKFFQ